MSLRLWPNNYENKDYISKEEKRLLRNASRNFTDGHFAVGIDPMGMNKPDYKMGLYISPNEGLVTFSIFEGDFKASYEQFYSQFVKECENIIYRRLLDSMHLIARNGVNKTLRFPYKHILIFPLADINTSCSVSDASLNSRIYRGFFRPINSDGKEKRVTDLKIFSDIRKSYDEGFESISDLECRCIFERLVPEYSVIVAESEVENIPTTNSITEKDMLISGKEAEYKTFFLDEYQVSIVNEMGKGHRVLLANPGAGKSVLLLSRAFKYSSLFKESNVLLTCYNNNLADSYKFKHECAGYKNKNLFIMTFHKLVKKIYDECLYTPIKTIEDSDIKFCIEKIKQGAVKIKFKAIFIDEVQIFDPMYLELCYLLLDKKDDSSFLMTGDLNQNIRTSSKRGDAPWKKMEDIHLDFTGRVKYIEKNYRNSKDISVYIKHMLELMNDRFSMLEMVNPLEYEYNTFKLGEKETIALEVIRYVPRSDIKAKVINAVQEISLKYKIAYNDIAILFPYKQYKTTRYFFLDWIKDGLDKKGIPYSVIIRSDENHTQFHNTSGVILSTIESSLGLDFKAVIVTGLNPYDYIYDESLEKGKCVPIESWESTQKMSPQNKSKVQNQMRTIYTACSRARDVLYVISDLKLDKPMDEIIRK